MATVKHTDAEFNGTATIGRRRLAFTDGKAVLDGPAAGWRRAGYEVSAEEDVTLLEDMTVAQLRDYATEHHIDVPAKARKAELVDLIAAGPLEPIPGSVDNGDGSYTWSGENVNDQDS